MSAPRLAYSRALAARDPDGIVARLNEDGQVRELTVFVCPLEALQLIAEVVGARMVAQFGPPGDQG